MAPAPRPTLLLIDADPDILKLMEFVFVGEPLELVTCPTPEQGLRVVATQVVDCVLIDIHFARTPECFGFLTALRHLPGTAHIPVIATSAMVGPEVMQHVRELGVRAFIPKPFFPVEILQEVRAVFAGPPSPTALPGGRAAPPTRAGLPATSPG